MSPSIFFCLVSLALLCSSSAVNEKRWQTFIRDSVSSITNTVNGIKLPLQFLILGANKERKPATSASSVVDAVQQQKEPGAQLATCEYKVKALQDLAVKQDSSLAAVADKVRKLEAKIRSLNALFAAYGLPAPDESDVIQVSEDQLTDSLTNYTIHDRCTYKNSSLVIAIVTGKQLVPSTCGANCNRMSNCGGFQFFSGYNGTQLRGCFYLHDSLMKRDLLCTGEIKIDQFMPERFAVFLKT